MDFELNPDLTKIVAEFALARTKNTAEYISDKLKGIKASSNKDEIIVNLEGIIFDLISDKNELIRISDAYQEQLVAQRISDEDIDFITEEIIPILEDLLLANDGEDAQKLKEAIDTFRPILSKETFSIMQLLGFNFKHALGEPLTKLIRASILSKTPLQNADLELEKLKEQRTIEYWKVLQDEEAYKRMIETR